MNEAEIKDVRIVQKKDCCGCGACYNSCPVGAITMEWDEEGFYYPVVHEDTCIQCGKCTRACPSLHPRLVNSTEPDCYAAYTEEPVREVSSSGGIFTLAAEYIMRLGGAVCGAAYDEKFRVSHIVVTEPEDLERLRGSKYVQSTTKEVYKDVEKRLKAGQYILFSGCSCQVAGLYSYLGKEYDTLFTIDLMCHGGPSPMVFEKYLQEVHGDKEITHVGFRDKDHFGWSTHMTVKYADGTAYRKYREEDPYYRAFLPCLSVRPHCQICKFARLPRQADMTLADFWGVEKYDPAFTDGKGTSILVTNSEKGRQLLEAIRPRLSLLEPVRRKYILSHGQPFAKPFRSNVKRDRFMKLVQKFPVTKAVECCERDWFDVGIYGVWPGCNYGSIMTYYALASTVEEMGYTVLMIEKPLKSADAKPHPMHHSRRFAYENYAAISEMYPRDQMGELNRHCAAFLMGSDQVWNYGIAKNFGMGYFLDFAKKDRKKLSYASSFGHDGFFADEDKKREVGKLLKRFDRISVREKAGVDILRDTFHVKGTQVLDPVFLQEASFYDKLVQKSRYQEQEKFMLSYILDPTPEVREALLAIAEKKGLKLINMLNGIPNTIEKNRAALNLPNTVEDLQVEEWLYYLRNCEFLITDSCHGSSFAILFEKPFLCLKNKGRGESRFRSLSETFHLERAFVDSPQELTEKLEMLDSFDFEEIGKILAEKREFSRNWLQEALDLKLRLSVRAAYNARAKVVRMVRYAYRKAPDSLKTKIRHAKPLAKYADKF